MIQCGRDAFASDPVDSVCPFCFRASHIGLLQLNLFRSILRHVRFSLVGKSSVSATCGEGRTPLDLVRQALVPRDPFICHGRRAKAAGTDPATGEVLCRCNGSGVASSKCSRPGQSVFSAVGNAAGCECVEKDYFAMRAKSRVETAALAFCEAATKHFSVPPVSACEEQLSNRKATGDYGRLHALLEEGPKTAAWHLAHVCRDECEELVNTNEGKLMEMMKDMIEAIPISEICADRVVKKVEAEIFGCCGQSCGWNGRSCISWPFFDERQKADWQAECCTEYNVSISVD